MHSNWKTRIAVVAGVAGIVVGGIVFATIPDGGGVIHGCYTRSTGVLRVIDDGVTNCKQAETSLSWNIQGQRGQQGLPGPIGPSDGILATQNPDIIQALGTEPVSIASVSLPAGSYVVNASVAAHSTETTLQQCDLEGSASGTGLGMHEPRSFRTFDEADKLTTLHQTSAFTLSEPDAITLWCEGSAMLGITDYSLTTITAIKVGSLTTQP